MKRTHLLLIAALAGAGAVAVLLLYLAGDAGALRGRAGGADGQDGAGTARVSNRGATVVPSDDPQAQRGQPSHIRSPEVLPGQRDPYDSPEYLAAQAQYSDRVVELLKETLDPSLKFEERRTRYMELQRLLRLMGHRVTPEVRQQLLQMLVTVEPRDSMLVGEAIGSLEGDKQTALALVDMLQGPDLHLRVTHAIYAALGSMNVREISGPLFGMIGEGREDEHLIVRTLGTVAGPDEVRKLFGKLDGPLRDQTRTEIELVLRQKATLPGLLDEVAGALDDADVTKRRSLLRILGASSNPEHAEKVRELLAKETDPDSRRMAIQALGSFGDPESANTLLDIVKTGSQTDQRRAVQAIHTIRNPETISMLAGQWTGLDAPGRLAVIGAAARLPDPSDDLVKLARSKGLYDEDMRVRSSAARLLGRPGQDDNVTPLCEFLGRAQHPSELSAALSALEQIGTKRAAEDALRALRSVTNERQKDRWMKRFEAIYDRNQ